VLEGKHEIGHYANDIRVFSLPVSQCVRSGFQHRTITKRQFITYIISIV